MFKKSLAAKVSGLTGGLIVLAIVLFAAVFVVLERNTLKDNANRSARIFATFSTAQLYQDYTQFYTRLDAADFEVFSTDVTGVLASNPDAVRVQLIAINGKMLMDSQEITRGRYEGPDRYVTDTPLLEQVKSGVFEQRQFSAANEDGALFQFIVPVNAVQGVHILSMVYSFSYATLGSQLAQIYRTIGAISLILFVVGVGLPIVFVRRVVRPLHELTAVVAEVGAGDFDVTIRAQTEDEIGVLATAFGKMVGDLKKSRDDLVAKITELERVIRVTVGRELRMIELKGELKKEKEETPTP